MRIGLVGGGTGGHFYPLIAVAETLRERYNKEDLHLYYFGPDKYSEKELLTHNIKFIKISAGKNRLYRSSQNFFDYFKIAWGIFMAMLKLPIIYPDIIFSKGGFTAYPVLFAARILRIPVVEHDSDTIPGRVSISFAKYSRLIAVSWAEGGKYFTEKINIKEEKIMETGLPIRKVLNPMYKHTNTIKSFNNLDKSLPLITVIGGSQGSQNINDAFIPGLTFVLPFAQVIHQTGKNNFELVKHTTDKLLENIKDKNNYICKDFFTEIEMREIYKNTSLLILRGGSSQILESFLWGIPTIIVPIKEEISRDQVSNAYAAMRRGAAIVIEEKNLTPHVLQNEILKLLQDNKSLTRMSASARTVAKYDASEKVANILLKYCKSHQ